MFQTYVTAGNQKPVHTNGQDSKEPEYMEICSAKQTENVAMQDNPAYSFDHQDKMAKQGDKVVMQDNPAYSFEHQDKITKQGDKSQCRIIQLTPFHLNAKLKCKTILLIPLLHLLPNNSS